MTISIIVITSIVSLTALYVNPNLRDLGMLKPYRAVREKRWYEMLTSGFLHASLGHLLVNMFVLYFFGVVMEQMLGTTHFLSLYLSGILISAVPSLVKFSDDPTYATLGASGAVESILFAFIFLNPTERLILLILPVPIPAWLFGLLFLAYSVYESKQRRGRVNHEAHITGAAWGIIYLLLFVPDSLSRFLSVFGL